MIHIVFINPLTLPVEILKDSLQGSECMQNLAQEGISMPMGIMYLSAHLKKYVPNIKVELIDYRANYSKLVNFKNIDDFIDQIALDTVSTSPDILAFSVVVSSSHGFFKKALDRLKNIWHEATVIVGGYHATNFTRELLELKSVNFIFRGEGEKALVNFIKNLHKNELINQIPGIVTRFNIDSMAKKLTEPLNSMDESPMPDYDLIDMDFYTDKNSRMVIKRLEYSKVKSANIITSLGCPFQCTFCSSRTVHGRKIRYKSVDNVVHEVYYLYMRWGVTMFLPEDDLFTANKKRTLEVLHALRDLKIPGFTMQFPVALSINTLDQKILDELIKTGMDVASLAIESGSDYVQRNIINKSVKLNKAKELVRYLRLQEIPVRCSFVLGFPSETRDQMQESINFALNLGADWNDFFVATPLAGSEMCDQFVELGYIKNDIDVISLGYYSKRTFNTPEISAQELSDLTYYANLYCNFVNNINLRTRCWNKALDLFLPIVNKYPFHLVAYDCIRRCYEGLGRQDMARECLNIMIKSIKENSNAQDMFSKYNILLSAETRNVLQKYTNQPISLDMMEA